MSHVGIEKIRRAVEEANEQARLLIAARRGDQETVMTLLAEKVKIDFTTHDSYTALAYAAGAGATARGGWRPSLTPPRRA